MKIIAKEGSYKNILHIKYLKQVKFNQKQKSKVM